MEDGWNLYVYVRNNPVARVDPSGQASDINDLLQPQATRVDNTYVDIGEPTKGEQGYQHGEITALPPETFFERFSDAAVETAKENADRYESYAKGLFSKETADAFELALNDPVSYIIETGDMIDAYFNERGGVSSVIMELGHTLTHKIPKQLFNEIRNIHKTTPESLGKGVTQGVISGIEFVAVSKGLGALSAGQKVGGAGKAVASGGNAAKGVTGGAARMQKYGHLWSKADLNKAVSRHAGSKATSWVSKTGKTIFENPATGRQVVVDQAGYFRIFQPKTFGSTKGVYLDMMGKMPSPARVVKGGAIKNVPLSGGALNQATHLRF